MHITAHPWTKVRARVESHGDAWLPLLRLLDWIREEQLEREIFAYTSMFDVVFTDRPVQRAGENSLAVSWNPQEKKMLFTYHRLDASTDVMRKEVSEGDSIETLREFFAYKFGVYRPKKNA